MRKYLMRNGFAYGGVAAGVRRGKVEPRLTSLVAVRLIIAVLVYPATMANPSHASVFSLSSSLMIQGAMLEGLGARSPVVLAESVPEPEPEPEPPPRPHRDREHAKTDSDDTRGRASWCRQRYSRNQLDFGQELGAVVQGILTFSYPSERKSGHKRKIRCQSKNHY